MTYDVVMKFYRVEKMRTYIQDNKPLLKRKFTIIFILDNGFNIKITKFLNKNEVQRELKVPTELGTERSFDDDIIEDAVYLPVNQIQLKFEPIQID